MTVHQKIMRAAAKGTGLRLLPSEVRKLADDDAIKVAAEYDDDQCSHGVHIDAYCEACDDERPRKAKR